MNLTRKIAGLFLLSSFGFAFSQSINFDTTNLDYGTIDQKADGNRTFIVKNTGDKPLIISRVQPSCGCTSPEWSKTPILPGKTGIIKVHYNTDIIGVFEKQVEVYSNDPEKGRTVVFIKGNVTQKGTAPVAASPVSNVKQKVATKKITQKALTK